MAKLHLKYDYIDKKAFIRMQHRVNKGQYLALDWGPSLSIKSMCNITITYRNWNSAIRAGRRFSKNKNISSVELDSGIVKLK